MNPVSLIVRRKSRCNLSCASSFPYYYLILTKNYTQVGEYKFRRRGPLDNSSSVPLWTLLNNICHSKLKRHSECHSTSTKNLSTEDLTSPPPLIYDVVFASVSWWGYSLSLSLSIAVPPHTSTSAIDPRRIPIPDIISIRVVLFHPPSFLLLLLVLPCPVLSIFFPLVFIFFESPKIYIQTSGRRNEFGRPQTLQLTAVVIIIESSVSMCHHPWLPNHNPISSTRTPISPKSQSKLLSSTSCSATLPPSPSSPREPGKVFHSTSSLT